MTKVNNFVQPAGNQPQQPVEQPLFSGLRQRVRQAAVALGCARAEVAVAPAPVQVPVGPSPRDVKRDFDQRLQLLQTNLSAAGLTLDKLKYFETVEYQDGTVQTPASVLNDANTQYAQIEQSRMALMALARQLDIDAIPEALGELCRKISKDAAKLRDMNKLVPVYSKMLAAIQAKGDFSNLTKEERDLIKTLPMQYPEVAIRWNQCLAAAVTANFSFLAGHLTDQENADKLVAMASHLAGLKTLIADCIPELHVADLDKAETVPVYHQICALLNGDFVANKDQIIALYATHANELNDPEFTFDAFFDSLQVKIQGQVERHVQRDCLGNDLEPFLTGLNILLEKCPRLKALVSEQVDREIAIAKHIVALPKLIAKFTENPQALHAYRAQHAEEIQALDHFDLNTLNQTAQQVIDLAVAIEGLKNQGQIYKVGSNDWEIDFERAIQNAQNALGNPLIRIALGDFVRVAETHLEEMRVLINERKAEDARQAALNRPHVPTRWERFVAWCNAVANAIISTAEAIVTALSNLFKRN